MRSAPHLIKGEFLRASAGTMMGWERVWKEGDRLLCCRGMPCRQLLSLWRVLFTRAAQASRIAELELANQHHTKQRQDTLKAAGNKGMKPQSSFLSICNTHLRMTPKQGWTKLNSSWGNYITFPSGRYTSEKYVGLDKIVFVGPSLHLVHKQNFGLLFWKFSPTFH